MAAASPAATPAAPVASQASCSTGPPNSALAARLGIYTPLPLALAKNIALNQPVVASTMGWGAIPQFAVDGRGKDGAFADSLNVPTGFHSSGTETVPWWQVYLGDSRPLGKVVIYNRTGEGASHLKDFSVAIFQNSHEVWRQHFDRPPDGYVSNVVSIPLPDGVEGNIVRIWMPNGGYLSLPEVEVYEPRLLQLDSSTAAIDDAELASSLLPYTFESAPDSNPEADSHWAEESPAGAEGYAAPEPAEAGEHWQAAAESAWGSV